MADVPGGAPVVYWAGARIDDDVDGGTGAGRIDDGLWHAHCGAGLAATPAGYLCSMGHSAWVSWFWQKVLPP